MSIRSIITITPTNVIAQKIDTSLDDAILETSNVDWKKGELGSALSEASVQFGEAKSLRILISDSLCHVTGITIDKKKVADRNYIQEQVSELIPEDLDIVKWDYAVSNIDDVQARIQVVSLTKQINEEFAKIDQNLKKEIKLLLPCSLALLESIVEKNESYVLIYATKTCNIISGVHTGLVKFVVEFEPENISKKLVQVFTYLQEYESFAPEKVVVSGQIPEEVKSQLQTNFKVVFAQVNAAVDLAEMQNISGPDKKVLSISFAESGRYLSELEKNLSLADIDSKSSNSKALFVLLLVVIAIVGLFLGYVVISQLLT